MTTLKFTTVGDGLGVVFPPEILDRLNASAGDEIKLIETPNGAILQRVDAKVAEQLEVAAEIMEEDKETLRRLAE